MQTFEATFTSTRARRAASNSCWRGPGFCQRSRSSNSSLATSPADRPKAFLTDLATNMADFSSRNWRACSVTRHRQTIGWRSRWPSARPEPDRFAKRPLSRLDRRLARRPGQAPPAHDDAKAVHRRRQGPGRALCGHEIPRFAFRIGRAVSPTIQPSNELRQSIERGRVLSASPGALPATSDPPKAKSDEEDREGR